MVMEKLRMKLYKEMGLIKSPEFSFGLISEHTAENLMCSINLSEENSQLSNC